MKMIYSSNKILYLLNQSFIHLNKNNLFVEPKQFIRRIKIIYLLNKNNSLNFATYNQP